MSKFLITVAALAALTGAAAAEQGQSWRITEQGWQSTPAQVEVLDQTTTRSAVVIGEAGRDYREPTALERNAAQFGANGR